MNTEVIVIGGGPAGLQATLTLARMGHPVTMLDSGEYRNAPVEHMHNLIGHDGQSPAGFRAAALADVVDYDSAVVRRERVASVEPLDAGFAVTLDSGQRLTADQVVLATGVRDTVPDVPGLAELFGTVAATCPYCHGHEYRGGRVAVLGNGPQASHLPALLGPIGIECVVLPGPEGLDDATTAIVARSGASVLPGEVERLEATERGADVVLAGGERLSVDGVFTATAWAQSAPFAEQLGLDLRPLGTIAVDAFGRTSLPGVYAAGDLAQPEAYPGPMFSVLSATHAGLLAASAIDMDRVAALAGH